MRLFDLPQAKHFCAPTTSAPGTAQSLASFLHAIPAGTTRFAEGSTRFEVYQISLLQSVERWILFSLAHYRRVFDMLVPVGVPWAQVTLYYSSFYAANAILGMFGGWTGQTKAGTRLVDVASGVPGTQEMQLHRKVVSPTGSTGSHRVFWDIFYDAAATIVPWAPGALLPALDPVLNDTAWQINTRNSVNYDMYSAWEAASHFCSTFTPAKLDSLSGPPRLQMEKSEQMIRLALHFAAECSLPGTALQGCGVTGSRSQVQKQLVTKVAPQLVTQSQLTALLSV
jgi:hypothetical protein